MSSFRFELDKAGVRELLKSEAVQQACMEHAEATRAACGDGYEAGAFTGKDRVKVNVWPSSAKARQDNAKNNTLLKALR